jgi:hypothetical protein
MAGLHALQFLEHFQEDRILMCGGCSRICSAAHRDDLA